MTRPYTEEDREMHYLDIIDTALCVVCEVGNVGSHGLGLKPQMIADLGEGWWRLENLSKGMNAANVLMRMAK